MQKGNLGDSKNIGDGLFEMRLHYGPGYRVYFCFCEEDNSILLCGGTNSTQPFDIDKARKLRKEIFK